MASNILKHLPRSYRQSSSSVRLQPIRSASGSGSTSTGPTSSQTATTIPSSQAHPITSQVIKTDSTGYMKLAVGLALGLSVGASLNNPAFIERFFPKKEQESKEENPLYTVLVERAMSQDRKVNLLENQLSSLREELRERDNQKQKDQQLIPQSKAGNVFELSEVIQANNLASEAKHSRDLEEQRKQMIREHLLKVEGEVLKVENKYRPTINKIRELEVHLENQRQIQQREAPARLLWLSCQSLLNRLHEAPQEPFENDPAYNVLKQFAASDNQLAMKILDSIPPKVLKEGVQSEETLTERFRRLEKVCKRVALVDSNGAGLGKYFLSYLQSLFIIDRNQPISDEEIRGQVLIDPTSWTTFDILARVQYCLARRNLEQAVRYANQLKGQARVVARDWIRDARLHLITKQALSALSTHAEAIAVDTT